jgi:hypothetical protein
MKLTRPIFAFYFLLLAFTTSAADLYINLVDHGLGLTSATNRTVLIASTSAPRGHSGGVTLLDKLSRTTDSAGGCWASNLVEGVYFIDVIKPSFVSAPAARTTFYVLVTNTTDIVYARDNIVASPGNTYPPDSHAWGAATSDRRYYQRAEGFLDVQGALSAGGPEEAPYRLDFDGDGFAVNGNAPAYFSGLVSFDDNVVFNNGVIAEAGLGVNGTITAETYGYNATPPNLVGSGKLLALADGYLQLETASKYAFDSNAKLVGDGSGLTNLVYKTNYVAADFTPVAGFIKLVGSNNALYAVSTTKTNLISAP